MGLLIFIHNCVFFSKFIRIYPFLSSFVRIYLSLCKFIRTYLELSKFNVYPFLLILILIKICCSLINLCFSIFIYIYPNLLNHYIYLHLSTLVCIVSFFIRVYLQLSIYSSLFIIYTPISTFIQNYLK